MASYEELWRAGQHAEALAGLAEHLRAEPDDARAWSLRGLYLLEQREPDPGAALAALSRSVEIEPTYPAAYNAGNILLDRGQFDAAVELYDLSVACFDGYPEAWVNRGIALHRKGRAEEAIASFDRALRVNAVFLPALRCKAMALEGSGDKEGSEALYAKMVEACPGDVAVLSEYARALSRLPPGGYMELEPYGREWKAIHALDAVVERNPDDLHAWLAKAEVLFRCMHANVCFRTSRFDYVPGPLRTGTFQGDLEAVLEAVQERFPDHPKVLEYRRELRAFRGV